MEPSADDGVLAPALVPALDPESHSIVFYSPTSEQHLWSKANLISRTRSVITSAIASLAPDVHPDRILYAVAGRCFVPSAPRPIGGRTNPGFREFEGSSAADLIEWLLDKAVEPPLGGRGRKKLDAGIALRLV
ncbi:hypothetical protein HK101_011912 [Irineochytrium annulatum]|nr:hypothetical protein HK101_011912 [Irineochytrium annulatum]